MNTSSVNRSAKVLCPTCQHEFELRESTSPPFCSERCRLIDLGRWLDEEIGLPHEGDPGETPVEHRSLSDDERME